MIIRLGEERFHASDCAKGSTPFRLQNKQTKKITIWKQLQFIKR
nr:MAG TPA: hypothetical protein [Caudoviricetes sp.]